MRTNTKRLKRDKRREKRKTNKRNTNNNRTLVTHMQTMVPTTTNQINIVTHYTNTEDMRQWTPLQQRCRANVHIYIHEHETTL